MTSLSLVAGMTVRVLGEDDAAENTKTLPHRASRVKLLKRQINRKLDFHKPVQQTSLIIQPRLFLSVLSGSGNCVPA